MDQFTTKLVGPAASYFRANHARLGLYPFTSWPDSVEVGHQAWVIINKHEWTAATLWTTPDSPRASFESQLLAEEKRQAAEQLAVELLIDQATDAELGFEPEGILAGVPFGD